MQTGARFLTQHRRGRVQGKPPGFGYLLCDEVAFQEVIYRETARSRRSGKPFLLVLIDVSGYGSGERLAAALSSSIREIDAKGWYVEGEVLGILFTEFGSMRDSVDAAGETIVNRLYDSLSGLLRDEALQITPYTLQAGLTTFEPLRAASLPGGGCCLFARRQSLTCVKRRQPGN